MVDIYLVGGFNSTTLKKYEFVSWDDDIPNMNGKIKVMFQTTNQKIDELYSHTNSVRIEWCRQWKWRGFH